MFKDLLFVKSIEIILETKVIICISLLCNLYQSAYPVVAYIYSRYVLSTCICIDILVEVFSIQTNQIFKFFIHYFDTSSR